MPTCDDNQAQIPSKCYRGQLAHGLPVTLYFRIQRVGLGRDCFFTVVTLVPLRMVMLLRDLHYDHLDIVEGHRQRGCSDMVAGNTGQILTEAGPSVHGVLLVAQLFCSSKMNFHLDLGATPSVQATVHQMGTFLIHFSILPFYTHCTQGDTSESVVFHFLLLGVGDCCLFVFVWLLCFACFVFWFPQTPCVPFHLFSNKWE